MDSILRKLDLHPMFFNESGHGSDAGNCRNVAGNGHEREELRFGGGRVDCCAFVLALGVQHAEEKEA